MSEVSISPASMRIVKLLVGNLPLTVADLIRETHVTRTAVTEQLNELMDAGFVERRTERLPGRGRPRHLYSATPAALLLLFASNQQMLVPAMWQAIADIGGSRLTQEVSHRVTCTMAAHYRAQITGITPGERLEQLTRLLSDEGHMVEVLKDGEGRLTLRKRSCEYIRMFEKSRTVCGVDAHLLSEVVGVPVRQVLSRHDGAPCCTFELVSTNGK